MASGTVGPAKADLIVALNAEGWAEAKADLLTKKNFEMWAIQEKRFTWNVSSIFPFNLK